MIIQTRNSSFWFTAIYEDSNWEGRWMQVNMECCKNVLPLRKSRLVFYISSCICYAESKEILLRQWRKNDKYGEILQDKVEFMGYYYCDNDKCLKGSFKIKKSSIGLIKKVFELIHVTTIWEWELLSVFNCYRQNI